MAADLVYQTIRVRSSTFDLCTEAYHAGRFETKDAAVRAALAMLLSDVKSNPKKYRPKTQAA